MQVDNFKLDIRKFHFSDKMDLTTFLEDLEKIPIGERDFDQKVLILKMQHGLIETISAADLNKVVVREWRSVQ